MCLIIVKDSGKELPKKEWLKSAEVYNRDGIGVCYHKAGSGEVVIKKDFKNYQDLHEWMKQNIKKEDKIIIHFRYATHGKRDEGARHPFPLTKNIDLLTKTNLKCKFALAHNGVISQYGNYKNFSDTQKFVFGIMSEESVKEHLNSQAIVTLIENFIGNDKLAIMKHDGTLHLFGEYVEDSGLLFSNTTYKQAMNYYTPTKSFDFDSGSNYGKCDGCGSYTQIEGIEIKHNSTVYDVNVCNKCKAKYDNKKGDFFDTELCENCGQYFKTKELSRTCLGLICKDCYKEHRDILGGKKNGYKSN